jgi:orotate phosphoribosyltransferase
VKELSIICPNTGGLPVAYGVCEALRAHQVYWAEQDTDASPMRFRQFVQPEEGEKVLLVDDILRSGRRLTELRNLVQSHGAEIVGLAVAVYQPNPSVASFGNLPLYWLAKMDASYYKDSAACDLCRRGVPLQKLWA